MMTAMMVMVGLCGGPPASESLKALQKLNEFIGEWKGTGGPDKPRPGPQDLMWKESARWSWKFQGDDAWLVLTVTDGKYLKNAELRYRAEKKLYELIAIDSSDKRRVYTGNFDAQKYLVLSHSESATDETHRLTFNTAAEGVRMVYRYAVKPPGRTIYARVFQVAANRAGESLAARESASKGPTCVVTGGLGTIAVSYQGKTFYVCCTGCRDAFNDAPEKYVK